VEAHPHDIIFLFSLITFILNPSSMSSRLNPNALGLAIGIFSAGSMLLMGLLAMNGYYTGAWEAMMAWHVWADLSVGGVIIGAVEGFVCGYICAYIIAWLYNRFAS
jgi:hypothetical protein